MKGYFYTIKKRGLISTDNTLGNYLDEEYFT